MSAGYKQLTEFLIGEGIEHLPHTGKTYLGHLVKVWRLMESQGCSEELCRAGLFHSIYGTQSFQDFKLSLERRGELRELIGERAERLAYLNCTMDRASFDQALDQSDERHRFRDRITGEEVSLPRADFDDLCRVHLYDWLEQVPRSLYGWGYRRESFRRMAERLGPVAVQRYEGVFAQEFPSAVVR